MWRASIRTDSAGQATKVYRQDAKIEEFALSYSGYEHHGEGCGKFANEVRHEYEGTSKLRDCLTDAQITEWRLAVRNQPSMQRKLGYWVLCRMRQSPPVAP